MHDLVRILGELSTVTTTSRGMIRSLLLSFDIGTFVCQEIESNVIFSFIYMQFEYYFEETVLPLGVCGKTLEAL